jgi:hypothetical protein
MKNLAFLFLVLSTLVQSSCDTGGIDCIRVSSNTISETRDHKDFTGVVTTVVGNLQLAQGAEYNVEILGPENVVERTNTAVQSNLLVISTDDCFNGQYELLIKVTAPVYSSINFSGIGNLSTTNTITSKIMEVDLLGIGDIDAEIEADTLYTNVSGDVNINYSGAALRHEFQSTGQFVLKAFPLITDHTSLRIVGIGDSEVTANETLKVVIQGTGNVGYKGDPQIEQSITGSGAVIDMN